MSEKGGSVDSSGGTIKFMELTLRQLGHMETDLTLAEKLYFLSWLDRVGVDEIVLWGMDADAEDIVNGARERGIGVEISWFGKVYFEDELKRLIDRAERVSVPLMLVGRGADFSLEVSGWTRQQTLDASVEAVKEAKGRGLEITIGLAYSTQADVGYLEEYAGAVAAAGADRYKISDSLGVASPRSMEALIRRMRAAVSIPIEVHCHDDFGLATANSIACVEAGADVVDVVVNGLDPERSGLASLDEVAVGLELLYGYKTNIKLDQLTALSRLHEQMTGVRVADSKPIVGRRAFNYRVAGGEAGSAPKRDHFYGSPKVVPFDPAIVGNERVFMIGKFSGKNEVLKRISDLGLSVSDDELATVVSLVSSRGAAKQRTVTDDELRYFIDVAHAAAGQRVRVNA